MPHIELPLPYRRAVRMAAKASRNNLPVVVVPGDADPCETGHSFYYETKGGKPISYPKAYAKRGWSSMRYVRSNRRVEVGADYLVRLSHPETIIPEGKRLTRA